MSHVPRVKDLSAVVDSTMQLDGLSVSSAASLPEARRGIMARHLAAAKARGMWLGSYAKDVLSRYNREAAIRAPPKSRR